MNDKPTYRTALTKWAKQADADDCKVTVSREAINGLSIYNLSDWHHYDLTKCYIVFPPQESE